MTRNVIILLLLTLFSCSKETINNEPYFQFDNIGLELLSELKLNDTLKFIGTNSTRQEYKIYKIEKAKEVNQDCSWNTGNCKIYYYFDKIQFYFVRTDSVALPPNSPLTYTLNLQMQIPLNVDKKNIPKDTKAKALISGNSFINFNAIPLNSPTYTSPYISYPDFYTTISMTTFTNSIRTYNDVIVLNSGNNSPYINPINSHVSTINEVWFDKKYGFVFFKDVFGNSWRRIN
jgi:hypothetical protein